MYKRQVLARYEQIKSARGVVDFDDILLCTAALLSSFPEVAHEVRRQYRTFVVDEYQDVSPLQQALLDLWRGDRDDLCVVGDPAQTIHSFAGAQASFLTGFALRHPSAQVIELVRDYRSTPEIISLANAVMRGHGPGAVSYTHLDVYKRQGVQFDRQLLGRRLLIADREPRALAQEGPSRVLQERPELVEVEGRDRLGQRQVADVEAPGDASATRRRQGARTPEGRAVEAQRHGPEERRGERLQGLLPDEPLRLRCLLYTSRCV